MGSNRNNNDPTLVNCYSSGNISGTYPGGLMGAHAWNSKAGTGINSYYLLSDTVSNSVGKSTQAIESTALTAVTQTIIDNLNEYIEENTDDIDTTGWVKWVLNKNSEPTLDFKTTWDGAQWVEE